jgi:hypothetical protein
MKQMSLNRVLVSTILLIALLTGCTAGPSGTLTENKNNPIANTKALGMMLGCAVAPHTCPGSKSQQKKDEEEIIQEFQRIDEERSAATAQ